MPQPPPPSLVPSPLLHHHHNPEDLLKINIDSRTAREGEDLQTHVYQFPYFLFSPLINHSMSIMCSWKGDRALVQLCSIGPPLSKSLPPTCFPSLSFEFASINVSNILGTFSLPKTSLEMPALEKFLQFQDSVPCKIRAKGGCATHTRNIAKRVRRTIISERMRKVQDVVPNMDKILVSEYGFMHLQLIPMLVGFFTYKIATFTRVIQEAMTIFEKKR